MRGVVAKRRVAFFGRSYGSFRSYVSPADVGPASARRRASYDIVLEPRSAYLLTGPARSDFEHHIPPVASLRYSVTFRTLRVRRGD